MPDSIPAVVSFGTKKTDILFEILHIELDDLQDSNDILCFRITMLKRTENQGKALDRMCILVNCEIVYRC